MGHTRMARWLGTAMMGMGVAASAGVRAQAPVTPAGDLLVSTAWVAQRLNDATTVVLHVGPAQAYATSHLPGARLVGGPEISVAGTSAGGGALSLQLPDAATLETKLEALGISDDSRVIVYAAAANFVSFATRVMATLDAAGLGDRSHLMDGGLPAWIAEGRPTTDVVPPVRTGTLRPFTLRPLVVDADVVQSKIGVAGTVIVDARLPAFYDGTQTGGGQQTPHKTGHITSAVNVPFQSLLGADGRFKPADEMRGLFTAAGVKPGDQVITYCHIGQQATVPLFVARLLGIEARLYDGSFEDWSRRPNAPVSVKK